MLHAYPMFVARHRYFTRTRGGVRGKCRRHPQIGVNGFCTSYSVVCPHDPSSFLEINEEEPGELVEVGCGCRSLFGAASNPTEATWNNDQDDHRRLHHYDGWKMAFQNDEGFARLQTWYLVSGFWSLTVFTDLYVFKREFRRSLDGLDIPKALQAFSVALSCSNLTN